MEIMYGIQNLTSKIIYAKPLLIMLQEIESSICEKTILILANQTLYEEYYDYFERMIGKTRQINWYICPNYDHCNHLSELNNLLNYIEQETIEGNLLVIGLGNRGLHELASYFCSQSIYRCRFFYIPNHFSGFLNSLKGFATIENNTGRSMLYEESLAEVILYDNNLLKVKGSASILKDLGSIIQLALTSDYAFLQELYLQFPTKKELEEQPFVTYIEKCVRLMEENPYKKASYGRVFFQGICQKFVGYDLPEYDKQLIGCLMQLVWSHTYYPFPFQFKNFFTWCQGLGFRVTFPVGDWLVSDLANGIIQEQKYIDSVYPLESIGKFAKKKKIDGQHLLKTIENYQQWSTE